MKLSSPITFMWLNRPMTKRPMPRKLATSVVKSQWLGSSSTGEMQVAEAGYVIRKSLSIPYCSTYLSSSHP